MDIFNAIELRHSYRGEFTDKSIPDEDLIKIVDAGIKAPSGSNAQTTEFIIVNDPELIGKISIITEKQFIKTAKAIIVCITEEKILTSGLSFFIEDCAAGVENMLLAITGLGYATVWLDGTLRSNNRAEKIRELLKIPENKSVRVILPLGIPKEKLSPKEKKPFNQRAWFNYYNNI